RCVPGRSAPMRDETPTDLTRTTTFATTEADPVTVHSLVGEEDGQRFELRPGAPLVVGRAPTSDLPIVHPTISRRHAELTAHPNDVEVRDLGSSNGTFLNGARVQHARARDGDSLSFGTREFRVVARVVPAT